VPVTERDRSRLAALIAIVRPNDSLAARLEAVTDDQREYYRHWKARCDGFIERYPNGEAYEKHLDGYGPFNSLRDEIAEALFGNPPQILNTDDDDKAAQIYRRYIDG
jgi:hypothetical protein